jgi:hypothetical protein
VGHDDLILSAVVEMFISFIYMVLPAIGIALFTFLNNCLINHYFFSIDGACDIEARLYISRKFLPLLNVQFRSQRPSLKDVNAHLFKLIVRAFQGFFSGEEIFL